MYIADFSHISASLGVGKFQRSDSKDEAETYVLGYVQVNSIIEIILLKCLQYIDPQLTDLLQIAGEQDHYQYIDGADPEVCSVQNWTDRDNKPVTNKFLR